MRNHLLVLASLAVLSLPAQAVTDPNKAVADSNKAVAALKSNLPRLEKSLAEMPAEFGLASTLLPYGEEPLPKTYNPSQAEGMAILKAKEDYWKGVLSSLVSAYAAKRILALDIKAKESAPMGKDFDRQLMEAMRDVIEIRLLENKIIAVKLVVSDIAEDSALVQKAPKVSISEIRNRLAKKKDALKKIAAALP